MVYSERMQMVDALIFGIVNGLTKFLPLSTAGHLALLQQWLTIDDINRLAFEASLHLMTALLVIIYFWTDIWTLSQAILRKLGRLPVNSRELTLFYALVLGAIPGIAATILLDLYIHEIEIPNVMIAGTLFLSALFLMYVEWRYYIRPTHEGVTAKRGWMVGLFQVLSLIPGFPRTGATIAGGMLVGMSRYEAARFSYLLLIPISLTVGAQKMIQLIKVNGSVAWGTVGVGVLIATILSFISLHFFLGYLKRGTLWPFIWYGVILAALVAYVTLIS